MSKGDAADGAMRDAGGHDGNLQIGGAGMSGPELQLWVSDTLRRLSHSGFRASFSLSAHDRDYARSKGKETINRHAHELLRGRIGDAMPVKDGKQTPYRGHPVFTAQHATAVCCRSCIQKWHHLPKGQELSDEEIDMLSALVMAWIERDLAAHPLR